MPSETEAFRKDMVLDSKQDNYLSCSKLERENMGYVSF